MERVLKKIIIFIIVLVVVGAAVIFIKGVKTFSVVTTGESLFSPSKDPRWDILVLGNRGEKAPGGGILTDSIMVLSYKKDTGDLAIFSIPRDLWVKIPNDNYQRINYAYAAGVNGTGKTSEGIKLAKKVVSEVSGLNIDFVVVADVDALKEVVDSINGIDIYEDKWFSTNFYGNTVQIHPGENHLNGDQASAYAGMRKLDSDFGRMKRQQKVILAIKDKLLSVGTISRPDKIFSILNVVQNNFKTDLNTSQIQSTIRMLPQLKVNSTKQIVFDNTNYLYSARAYNGAYILLPNVGEGNYSEIHNVFKNIFEKEPQQVQNEQQKTQIINRVGKF
jgi:LCP family protein required for cell wall assembly